MAAKQQTAAARITALEEGMAAILAAVTQPAQDTPVQEAKGKKGKQTTAKAKRVQIPTHTNREPDAVSVAGKGDASFPYSASPDSKYKGYTLIAYLKEDGTVRKHVRVHNSILRDLMQNGTDVVNFDWR